MARDITHTNATIVSAKVKFANTPVDAPIAMAKAITVSDATTALRMSTWIARFVMTDIVKTFARNAKARGK